MKESLSLRFLYNTAPGRALLKLLVHPLPSKAMGAFMDSGLSRPYIKIFARANCIDMAGVKIPEEGFKSFNAFFTREYENVEFNNDKDTLCSPCNGYLLTYDIDEQLRFDVKNCSYSVEQLFRSRKFAEEYAGGKILIYRLTPANYHRYHFVDDGEIVEQVEIPGVLHCVRPIALDRYPVFVENAREYTLFESVNFGKLVQMEVGALFIGRIRNHSGQGRHIRGEEKGCFEFGGSTIIMAFKKGAVVIDEEILRENQLGNEVLVELGQPVGKAGKIE